MVFDSPPPPDVVPTCPQAGVLGSIAGILGTIQATEVLKFLVNKGELLINRILTFNALSMEFRTIVFSKNKNCPICGEHPSITKLQTYELPACDLKH